jgi:large subunit ribosomal protein L13
MKTYSPSSNSITRKWHLYDAKGQILGRLATQIAKDLMGKGKPEFVRHLDIGDNVVVINAAEIAVTGHKMDQKLYHHHSGFPGGMRVATLGELMEKHPQRAIENAVKGMLPRNKLHDRMMKHLHVYAGPEHPYAKQFKQADK